MNWIDLAYLLTGLLLCLTVVVHSVSSARRTWQQHGREATAFGAWQVQRRAVFDARQPDSNGPGGVWKGWRSFRVLEIRNETAQCRSIYLAPGDGKPVPTFCAGQYLTLRIQVPGDGRFQTRCYSLSSPPGSLPYRITVKEVPAAPATKAFSMSRYLNQQLRVGDWVELKAPAGDFYVDPNLERPIVLLAAGVGITPLVSMARDLIQIGFEYPIVLFYGNPNRRAHIFAKELAALATQAQNFVVVNCYSQPDPGDRPGVDFHFSGRVTVDRIRQTLKTLDVEFYLCGPASFMESLYHDLRTAGVAEAHIHSEAFGPASVRIQATQELTSQEQEIVDELAGLIAFARSSKQVQCPANKTILDVAEISEIPIESGCRAGNCGTCAVRLLKGSVKYPKGAPAHLEPGTCLTCIAQPQGEILVEA